MYVVMAWLVLGTSIRVPGYPFQYPSGTQVLKYPEVPAVLVTKRLEIRLRKY